MLNSTPVAGEGLETREDGETATSERNQVKEKLSRAGPQTEVSAKGLHNDTLNASRNAACLSVQQSAMARDGKTSSVSRMIHDPNQSAFPTLLNCSFPFPSLCHSFLSPPTVLDGIHENPNQSNGSRVDIRASIP